MRVKTYRGSRNQVMEKVKEELGAEAMILSTRELPGSTIELAAGLEGEGESSGGSPADGPIIMLDRILDDQPSVCFQGQESIEAIFASQGLSAALCEKLLQHVDGALAQSGAPLDKIIGESLAHLLHFDAVLPRAQRVIALVGAPGVGKTTTIAKLAAQLHAAFNLRIGLIAADSFRVGAGFHLQTYASIMHMPFRLLDPDRPFSEELRRALAAFSRLDLIFIDTPGLAVREHQRIEEIAQRLAPFKDVERMLVVPAPSNEVDLLASARALAALHYERIILSKVDESTFIGPAINTVLAVGKALAFFTTGQRVPEDIEPASARRMGWMLTRTIH